MLKTDTCQPKLRIATLKKVNDHISQIHLLLFLINGPQYGTLHVCEKANI